MLTLSTILGGLAITIISLALSGCGSPRQNPQEPRPRPAKVVNAFDQARVNWDRPTINESGPAGPVWKLQGRHAQATGSQLGWVEGAEGIFFEKGKPVLKIVSPHVTIDYAHSTLQLDKTVATALPAGTRSFQANEVVWTWSGSKGLVATGDVAFRDHSLSVQSGRLDADIALRRAVLTERPTASAPEGGL